MSWWHTKCTNDNGEYEITFGSKHYAKAKAVEKVCCAVIDNVVKSPLDVEVVVRCKDCARCVPYKGVLFCNKWRTFPEVELDGFCSYGERKGGAGNE